YVETDFLGAAPTANYVESNSWTPRLRQLWVQLDRPSGWTITAGQTWSLLTSNEKGIATLAELRPGTEDGQYVVGFTWTRQREFRVRERLKNKVGPRHFRVACGTDCCLESDHIFKTMLRSLNKGDVTVCRFDIDEDFTSVQSG